MYHMQNVCAKLVLSPRGLRRAQVHRRSPRRPRGLIRSSQPLRRRSLRLACHRKITCVQLSHQIQKARMSQIPRRPWTRTLLTPRYHLSHQVKMYGNSVCADEAIEIPTGHQICLKHHIKIASKLARLKLPFINPRQPNQR